MKPCCWGILLTLLSVTGCKKELALLGRNSVGEPIQSLADPDRYRDRLVRSLGEVNESALAALKTAETRTRHWELQLLTVGVVLDATAGFGPFKVGVQPGIRAFFTNTATPPPLP